MNPAITARVQLLIDRATCLYATKGTELARTYKQDIPKDEQTRRASTPQMFSEILQQEFKNYLKPSLKSYIPLYSFALTRAPLDSLVQGSEESPKIILSCADFTHKDVTDSLAYAGKEDVGDNLLARVNKSFLVKRLFHKDGEEKLVAWEIIFLRKLLFAGYVEILNVGVKPCVVVKITETSNDDLEFVSMKRLKFGNYGEKLEDFLEKVKEEANPNNTKISEEPLEV